MLKFAEEYKFQTNLLSLTNCMNLQSCGKISYSVCMKDTLIANPTKDHAQV